MYEGLYVNAPLIYTYSDLGLFPYASTISTWYQSLVLGFTWAHPPPPVCRHAPVHPARRAAVQSAFACSAIAAAARWSVAGRLARRVRPTVSSPPQRHRKLQLIYTARSSCCCISSVCLHGCCSVCARGRGLGSSVSTAAALLLFMRLPHGCCSCSAPCLSGWPPLRFLHPVVVRSPAVHWE